MILSIEILFSFVYKNLYMYIQLFKRNLNVKLKYYYVCIYIQLMMLNVNDVCKEL